MRIELTNKKTVIFLLIIFNLIIYSNGLFSDFVWDDFDIVKNNNYLKDLSYIGRVLTSEDAPLMQQGTGFYRPIVYLSFMLDYQVYGGTPFGFKLTSMMMHILCSIILFLFFRLLTEDNLKSFLATLIFSAQTVNVESVTFIAARSNVLCTLFILLSMYYYVKNSKGGKQSHFVYSLLYLFLGAASKEFSFMVPLIFILYDYTFRDDFSLKRDAKKYAAAFGVVFLFLIIKSALLTSKMAISFDFPNMHRRLLLTMPVMLRYMTNQIFPYNLSIYFGLSERGFSYTLVFFSLAVLIALFVVIFRYRKEQKLLFFSFFTYFILLIPVSNVIVINGAMMADRWLYPASFAFAMVIVQGIYLLMRQNMTRTSIVAVALVLLLSVLTVQRNMVFMNNYTLFTDCAKKFPRSGVILSNLADEYWARGELEKAEKEYMLAIKYAPWLWLPYNNLGALYKQKKEYKKAIVYFKKSYELYPESTMVVYNIADSLRHIGKLEESNRYYNLTISLSPDFYEAYCDLAANYVYQKKYDEAYNMFDIVLKNSPDEKLKGKVRSFIDMINK